MVDYALTMLRAIFIYIVCLTPLIAAESAGYRIVHPDGSVEFTDQPAEGAEPIKLPELPTYSAPPSAGGGSAGTGTATTTEAAEGEQQKEKKAERSITITSPGAEETISFDAAGISVSVQVSPALSEGEQVIIRLDGSEVARGSATGFKVQGAYRGAHVLSAAVADSGGTVQRESTPITFYIRQHSLK